MRQTLDPQVTTLLEQIHTQAAAQAAPQTPLSQEEMIAETRQFMASTLARLAIASESVARVEDREIPGPGGMLRCRAQNIALSPLDFFFRVANRGLRLIYLGHQFSGISKTANTRPLRTRSPISTLIWRI